MAQGGQIMEIVNIEVFNGFHGVKYAYNSSKNGLHMEQRLF